jgi:phage terminase small subunit
MSDERDHLIDLPPEDQQGPSMRRLNEQQRRFVCALSVFGGNRSEAYRWAGYKTTNDNSTGAAASRIHSLEEIKDAIREEAIRRLDTAPLLAISTMVRLAGGTDDKLALKASEMILDRTGFHGMTEHKVTIEDKRTTKELIDFIMQAAPRHGLDANKMLGLSAPVDAEFTEVDPDLADLI